MIMNMTNVHSSQANIKTPELVNLPYLFHNVYQFLEKSVNQPPKSRTNLVAFAVLKVSG